MSALSAIGLQADAPPAAQDAPTRLFVWRGVDARGRKLRGEQCATDLPALHARLAERDIVPYRVRARAAPSLAAAQAFALLEQFASLFRAGLPMPDALRLLADNARDARVRRATLAIRHDVEAGNPLSEALRRRVRRGGALLVGVVRLGENSGRLDEALAGLLASHKTERRLRAQLLQAATYPAIVTVASLAVTLLLAIYMVPAFKDLYGDMDAALPMQTVLTIRFSDFLIAHGGVAALWLGAAALVVTAASRLHIGARALAELRLRAPLFGPLRRAYLCRKFADCLLLVYRSGMPLDEALGLLPATSQDPAYRAALLRVHRRVREGDALHRAVADARFFPLLVERMLCIGENSGRLDETLENLAAHYSERLEAGAKRLTSLLEPCLILFVAGLVSWVVVAMYLPIFNIGLVL